MKTKAGKKVLLTLVCAALTIALGACSGDKAGKESSQITIGIPQDVDSLDPHKAVAAGTKEVLLARRFRKMEKCIPSRFAMG